MKLKRAVWIAFPVILILSVLLLSGGRSTYDYELTCTNCLQDHHVIERKIVGITYSRTSKLTSDPPDYPRIRSSDCDHIFHRGGFGRTRRGVHADGMTSEGAYFRDRNQLIRQVFRLHRQFEENALANETLDLTNRLLPPDADWSKQSQSLDENRTRLLLLKHSLEEVDSLEQWKELVAVAKSGTIQDLEIRITQQVEAPDAD